MINIMTPDASLNDERSRLLIADSLDRSGA